MYLRTTARRTKGGQTVRYLALAHNERNARGVPVARVIHNLGREDLVDRDGLARLVASIQRFLGGEDGLRAGAPHGFEFVAAPESGGPHVVDELWAQLGIGKAVGRAARAGRGRAAVERAIFAMVCQRCLEPASKLEATRWIGRDVVIDGIDAVSDDQLYRAMDFLLDCAERVQESVFFSVASLLNLEVDVIFFDTTSTYFETEPADDLDDDRALQQAAGEEREPDRLRRLGHSKDHRPDLPQVVIGLAVTREGIPVRCWVWPGNTNDQSVIGEVKADLTGWRLGRVITVIDSGFSGRENLRTLRSAGGHYIAGMKLRSGMPETEQALARQGRYRTIADNLRVKEVRLDDDAAQRFIVCHNPAEAERDRARRQRHIERIQAELDRLKAQREKAKTPADRAAHARGECALRDHRTLSRYLRQTKTGRLVLDRERIAAEQRLDGKYLLTTSDPSLPAEDVALGYKRLLEAERSFRDLKGTLLLRPVYHRTDERIRAHVLICFLALVVVRAAETRTGRTWRQIRAELGQIRQGHFRGRDGEFTQTTELTAAQRDLHTALGVPEPPRFGRITPA